MSSNGGKMKHRQIIGLLLLLLALIVIAGMLFANGNQICWFVIDITSIVTCCGCGLYLLFKKPHT